MRTVALSFNLLRRVVRVVALSFNLLRRVVRDVVSGSVDDLLVAVAFESALVGFFGLISAMMSLLVGFCV